MLLKIGFNLYLFGLILPFGSLIGLASFSLWIFGLTAFLSYHLINHYYKMDNLFKVLKEKNTLLYLGSALFILTYGHVLGLSSSLLSLAIFIAAPFIVEATIIGIMIGYAKYYNTVTISNEDKIKHAVIQGNENLLNQVLNSVNSPQELLKLGLKVMHDPNDNLFKGVIARLKALGEANLSLDNNLLLRAAIYHKRSHHIKTLLSENSVKKNAHAGNNAALKEACICGDSEAVAALLQCPSVIENINTNNGEAARLAEKEEHWDVLAQLLGVPAVANFVVSGANMTFTERNVKKYGDAPAPQAPEVPKPAAVARSRGSKQAEVKDLHVDDEEDQDLKRFAEPEGSMRSTNERQNMAMAHMKERYQAEYKRKGEEAIFAEILTYMKVEYDYKPAKIFGFALPLTFGKWKFLVKYFDNISFYQHAVHTAHRFLFLWNHNPWLYPGRLNELTDEDRTNIAYMWLAATDIKQKLPDGCTRESLLEEFLQAVYELGRSHNYDKTRSVIRKRTDPITKEVTEYVDDNDHYDDLEGDKPTCKKGVNQRVIQFYMVFLNDRPETRPLTPEVMRMKFQQEMVDESKTKASFYNKLKALDKDTLAKLEKALENLFVINLGDMDAIEEDERALLKQLEFTKEEVTSFVEDCKKYFGPKRITEEKTGSERVRYQEKHYFTNYEGMITFLATHVYEQFLNAFTRNIALLKAGHGVIANPNAESSPDKVLLFSNPKTAESQQIAASAGIEADESVKNRISALTA